MTNNILINNIEEYGGKYVATKDFLDKNVLASDSDPLKVLSIAKEKGVKHPVVFYVPPKDVIQLY